MKQRIVLSGASAACVLMVLLFWLGNNVSRASAMEKVAESIRNAKSFKAAAHVTLEAASDQDKKKAISEYDAKFYWKAPDAYRVETKKGPDMESIHISSRTTPGIEIDPAKKEYRRLPAEQGPGIRLMMIDKLGEYRGQAKEDLGFKEINGVKAHGFVVDGRIIDPDAPDAKVEIWTDSQSNLPIQVFFTVKMDENHVCTMRMEDIQWNLDLDAQLFSTKPPEGYSESRIPGPLTTESLVYQITESLKIYAELSGGHYPQVQRIYGDQLMFEVRKMLGVDKIPSQEQMRDEKIREDFMKRYTKATIVSFGMGDMTRIQRDNPDAAYYGKTVIPKDKDKVLFRWKLDDGRYEVIFGDLRAETMTAERLHQLEGGSK